MSFTNTPERYGVISAAFHWLSAIIVYGMFALGLWMVTLSYYDGWYGNDSNLLIVFYVQIMPDDFVMQLHR
ncbi:hypothetical protein P2O60_04315, partial [Escherichia coli]